MRLQFGMDDIEYVAVRGLETAGELLLFTNAMITEDQYLVAKAYAEMLEKQGRQETTVKWEYKSVDAVMGILNKAGQEGWEAVTTVTDIEKDGYGNEFRIHWVLMKRPISEIAYRQ